MKQIWKWVNNRKLKTKMIIIYGLIGFLPIFILFSVFYCQMQKILIERDTKSLEAFIYEGAVSMNNQVLIYDNLSNYISFNQTISQVVNFNYHSNYEKYSQIVTTLDPLLASLKYFHDNLKQVTIYLENEAIKHDTTLAPLDEIRHEKWFQQVINENAIVWVVDKEKKEAFSVRVMPTLAENGVMGVLYLNVDYDMLFASFEQTIRPNYGIFIMDSNQNVIYSNNQFLEKYTKYELEYEEYLNELHMQKNHKSDYTIVEVEALNGTWNVGLYMPKKLIVSSMTPLVLTSIVTLISCIIVSIIAIFFTSKFITKRISGLAKNMKEVEKGNFLVTVKSEETDEIGDLIRGFGKMIYQIHNLIKEVYEGKLKQKAYEMKALQSQINPHFLYNTLSLINWKAIEAENEEISKITLALSMFYRTSLNRGKNTLRVGEEIENVKSYLQIQSVMHDDEIIIEYKVDKDILEYEMLNLILQPIVENAIEHGLEVKEIGEKRLTISGKLEEKNILLIVEDNGIGMEQEKAECILTEHTKGYGIKNVNDRICLYYGEAYGLQMESKVGVGTKVYVKLPIRKTYS